MPEGAQAKAPRRKRTRWVRTRKTLLLAFLLLPLGENPKAHPSPEASSPCSGRPRVFPALSRSQTSPSSPTPKTFTATALG